MQEPPTQRLGIGHDEKQVPQWLGSLARSTHVPPQKVPDGQEGTQAPFTHSVSPMQATLQPPQFARSKRQSTHFPSQ
jgi:hypothetical protein